MFPRLHPAARYPASPSASGADHHQRIL